MRHKPPYILVFLATTMFAGTCVGTSQPVYGQEKIAPAEQKSPSEGNNAPAEPEPTEQEEMADYFGSIADDMERKMDLVDSNPDISVAEIDKELVFDALPDGQTLLMRPKVGRLIYEYDIYGLKKNNRLMFSLVDMIDILGLAIDFKEDTKTGQGWFLREDWTISFDLNNGRVVSRGQEYTISPENVVDENGIVFVSAADLGEWFDMEFVADISQQYLDIISAYPLPSVAQNYRRNNKNASRLSNNITLLPRLKSEYQWFDINAADFQLGTRVHRADQQRSTVRHTASVAAAGQVLKHEAYALAGYNNEDKLNTVVARLSRHAEDPELLGPLKARSYTLGDTDTTDIPLTGNTTQELGFRVSNSNLTNNQFETTDVEGDALPGWDVELYRNGILAGTQTVDETGRYVFTDIQLFGGNNDFEVFFYGPQGEVRNKTVSIPVTQALLQTQNNTYDVSVSFAESRTYQKNKSEDVDENSPHFAARFNKVIGDTLAYIGFRNRDIEGENKTFLASGFTKFFRGTVYDGNFGLDQKGNAAAELIARRNIHKWDIAVSALVQGEDYNPDESTNPAVMKLTANALRSFEPAFGQRATVSAYTSYSELADGQSQFLARLGGGYRVGKLNLSDTLTYQTRDNGEVTPGSLTTFITSSSQDERLYNTFSVRSSFGKVFVRGGVDYDIVPDSQIDKYFTQISYYPRYDLSGDLTLEHDPVQKLSTARLNVNYTNKHFRTSPFIELDTDHELYAGVNVNFALAANPNEFFPEVTSKRVVGRGMVNSFVYYDKNGNFKFDEADEPLPEVIIESRNIRRRVETDEKGYSFMNDLPTARATDIYVDKETLPDPYMIAGFQGVSIFPSAGEVVELEFPIHMSGEIDGTVSIKKLNGEKDVVKKASIVLFPLAPGQTEKIVTEAAFDGFYVASQVPPGDYIMTVSNETLSKLRASAPPPRLVRIGYEGDTLYGYNFELEEKQANVPVTVTYLDPQDLAQFQVQDVVYSLKTPTDGGSRLLQLVGNLGGRQSGDELFAGLQEVDWDLSEGERRFVTRENTLQEAYEACRTLVKNAKPCALEIIVPSQGDVPAVHTASR